MQGFWRNSLKLFTCLLLFHWSICTNLPEVTIGSFSPTCPANGEKVVVRGKVDMSVSGVTASDWENQAAFVVGNEEVGTAVFSSCGPAFSIFDTYCESGSGGVYKVVLNSTSQPTYSGVDVYLKISKTSAVGNVNSSTVYPVVHESINETINDEKIPNANNCIGISGNDMIITYKVRGLVPQYTVSILGPSSNVLNSSTNQPEVSITVTKGTKNIIVGYDMPGGCSSNSTVCFIVPTTTSSSTTTTTTTTTTTHTTPTSSTLASTDDSDSSVYTTSNTSVNTVNVSLPIQHSTSTIKAMHGHGDPGPNTTTTPIPPTSTDTPSPCCPCGMACWLPIMIVCLVVIVIVGVVLVYIYCTRIRNCITIGFEKKDTVEQWKRKVNSHEKLSSKSFNQCVVCHKKNKHVEHPLENIPSDFLAEGERMKDLIVRFQFKIEKEKLTLTILNVVAVEGGSGTTEMQSRTNDDSEKGPIDSEKELDPVPPINTDTPMRKMKKKEKHNNMIDDVDSSDRSHSPGRPFNDTRIHPTTPRDGGINMSSNSALPIQTNFPVNPPRQLPPLRNPGRQLPTPRTNTGDPDS